MSDGARFRRLARRTVLTCRRGLARAAHSLAGAPLFFVSLLSVVSLAAGIGVPARTWRTFVRARCSLDRTVPTGMASARDTS